MSNNNSEEFNALDYPIKMEFDAEDSLFTVEFLDLPGCSAQGATVAEAYDHAQKAKAEWIRLTLKQGLPIPKPSKSGEFSGRILVRMPEALHAMLASRARINNTSLNQYIVHLLSAGAIGEEFSRKIEILADQVQRLEERITAGFARSAAFQQTQTHPALSARPILQKFAGRIPSSGSPAWSEYFSGSVCNS